MTRFEECAQKLVIVREMLGRSGLDGVIIKKQANFSWLTAGGRGFIGLAGDVSCGMLVVTQDKVFLAANNIEAPRLAAEEMPEGFAEIIRFEWPDDGNIQTEMERRCGKLSDDIALDAWFKETRTALMPSEIERFSALGAKSAAALEQVCMEAEQGVSEFEIAGRISSKLWAEGIEPITLLIAADERSQRVRHYVPTCGQANRGFIASLCARQGGLVVSLSRSVSFVKDFAADYDALLHVEQAAFEATARAKTLGEVFTALTKAYEQNGFAGEWRNHHQGGMTGYLAREYRADAVSKIRVEPNKAYAWNPSAAGVKCEDTVLLQPDGALQIFTACGPSWPTVTAGGVTRPDVLRR